MTPQEALRRCIEIVGSRSAIAVAIGISREAVQQWDVVPVARVLDLERLTGAQVTRSQLRPDIYPDVDNHPAEAAQ